MGIEPALVIDAEEKISKVISKMRRSKKPHAVALRNGKFLGIVSARMISGRKINVPEEMKVSKFVTKTKISSFDDTLQLAVGMLKNKHSIAVFKKNNKFFTLTKLNALKSLPSHKIPGKKAGDIMSSPFCVSEDDTISTAMSLFRDLSISVLPVIDSKDHVIGFLDPLSMLGGETTRQRIKRGGGSGESIKTRSVNATSLMKKSFPSASARSTLKCLIRKMHAKKVPFVFIEEGRKIRGIVTPTDILKLFSKQDVSPRQMPNLVNIPVIISGINDEDPFIRKVVMEEAWSKTKKLSKIIPIQSVLVRIDRHHKEGRKTKYSLRARVVTERGMFFAQTWSWDVTKSIKEILSSIEREIIRKKERSKKKRTV